MHQVVQVAQQTRKSSAALVISAPEEEVKVSSLDHNQNDSAMKSPDLKLASYANERGGVKVRIIEGQNKEDHKS